MKPQPDALYLFFCHLEWRDQQNSDAHKELVTALKHEDIEMRQVAESLLHRKAETPDKLNIKIAERKDDVLMCLSGRIDVDSSPALRDQLLALLESQRSTVVSVDFLAVTHMDSSGIATLIEALKIARGYKTDLKLQGLHDALLRVFQFTGILPLFNGSGQTFAQSASEVV